MKKTTLIFYLLLISSLALAQKSEKIKGSKTVTIEQKEIGDFNTLEIGDNLEIYLVNSENCELKIEADDNLHDVISFDLKNKTLRISTSKTISSYKKLIVRISYNKSLKTISINDNVLLNAIQEIQLDSITLKAFDNSEMKLNVNSKNFTLQMDNNVKTDLNLKSEKATLQLSKNSNLKALISSTNLKCDLYQKAKATLEGDVTNGSIRLDNNAALTAHKLIIKNASLVAESYTDCSINASETLSLDASGNSEIRLYGEQKIEIKRFMDAVILTKKPTK